MYNRTYNFSAGPATMPVPVLEEIRDELLNYRRYGRYGDVAPFEGFPDHHRRG